MWDFQKDSDKRGDFIVNSDRIVGVRDITLTQINIQKQIFYFSERADTPGKSLPSSNLHVSASQYDQHTLKKLHHPWKHG